MAGSKVLGSFWFKIGITNTEMIRGLQEAEKNMQKFAFNAKELGKNLTFGVTLPMIAMGKAAVESAMNAVEMQNLFEVSMGKMSDKGQQWAEAMQEAYGINKYGAMENIAVFNQMFQSLGLTNEAAYGMSQGLAQLAYDMASLRDIPIDVAFEKLRSGIMGEIEPLRQLGIDVTEDTTKVWALNNGLIKKGETLTQTGKALARYGVILKATSNDQGDLARTLNSPANKLRIFQEKVEFLSIKIGELLLPAFVDIINFATKVVNKLQDLAEWFNQLPDPIKKIASALLLFTAGAGPGILIIGTLAGSFMNLLEVIKLFQGGSLMAGLNAIIGALTGQSAAATAAATATTANAAAQTAATPVAAAYATTQASAAAATTSLAIATTALQAPMLALPTTAIVPATAALTGFSGAAATAEPIFVGFGSTVTAVGTAASGIVIPITAVIGALALAGLAIKKYWDENQEFRDNVAGLWAEIETLFKNVGRTFEMIFANIVEGYRDFMSEHGDQIQDWVDRIGTAVDNIVTMLRDLIGFINDSFAGDWENAFVHLGDIFKNTIKNIFNAVIFEPLFTVLDSIVNDFEFVFSVADRICRGMASLFGAAGRSIYDSMKNWLVDKLGGVFAFVENALDGLRKMLGLKSSKDSAPDSTIGKSVPGIGVDWSTFGQQMNQQKTSPLKYPSAQEVIGSQKGQNTSTGGKADDKAAQNEAKTLLDEYWDLVIAKTKEGRERELAELRASYEKEKLEHEQNKKSIANITEIYRIKRSEINAKFDKKEAEERAKKYKEDIEQKTANEIAKQQTIIASGASQAQILEAQKNIELSEANKKYKLVLADLNSSQLEKKTAEIDYNNEVLKINTNYTNSTLDLKRTANDLTLALMEDGQDKQLKIMTAAQEKEKEEYIKIFGAKSKEVEQLAKKHTEQLKKLAIETKPVVIFGLKIEKEKFTELQGQFASFLDSIQGLFNVDLVTPFMTITNLIKGWGSSVETFKSGLSAIKNRNAEGGGGVLGAIGGAASMAEAVVPFIKAGVALFNGIKGLFDARKKYEKEQAERERQQAIKLDQEKFKEFVSSATVGELVNFDNKARIEELRKSLETANILLRQAQKLEIGIGGTSIKGASYGEKDRKIKDAQIQVDAIQSEIDRLSGNATEVQNKITAIIGATIESLMSGVAGVFSAENIKDFANNFDTIFTKTMQQSVVNTFVAERLRQPLEKWLEALKGALGNDGVLSPDEISNLNQMRDAMETTSEKIYQDITKINKVIKDTTAIAFSIESAFGAADLGEFKTNLKTSIYDSVKKSLIESFMENAGVNQALTSLGKTAGKMVQDGVLSTGEINTLQTGIDGIYSSTKDLFNNILKITEQATKTLSISITSAFNAVDFKSFRSNVKDTVYGSVTESLISSFLDNSGVNKALEALGKKAAEYTADGKLSATEVAAINSEVDKITKASQGLFENIQQLGDKVETIVTFSIESAFEAADLKGFKTNLKESIMESVKKALISSFLENAGINAALEELGRKAGGMIQDGILSQTELATITNEINNIYNASKGLFESVTSLTSKEVEKIKVDLSSAIEGAFKAATFEEFNQNLMDAVHDSIKDALIASFLETPALKDLITELNKIVSDNIADNILTGEETKQIDSKVKQISSSAKEMFGNLTSVFQKAADIVDTVSDSLSNAFKAASVEEFGSSLYESVYGNVKSALFDSLINAPAIKGATERLSTYIADATRDGVLTGAEQISIKTQVEAIKNQTSQAFGTISNLFASGVEKGLKLVDFSGAVSSAFDAANITDFTTNIKDSLRSAIRSAVIDGFLQGSTFKPLLDRLSTLVAQAMSDGYLNATEMSGIKAAAAAIEQPAAQLYGMLESLGIGAQSLAQKSSSLGNIPAGSISTSTLGTSPVAVKPTNSQTITGNTFNITANDPSQLYNSLQTIQQQKSITQTGNPVATTSKYYTK